jgi:hypothetical protein
LNFQDNPSPELVLRSVLARNPTASLHEIRHAHPALRRMSLDQLGLRVGQMVERQSRTWLK